MSSRNKAVKYLLISSLFSGYLYANEFEEEIKREMTEQNETDVREQYSKQVRTCLCHLVKRERKIAAKKRDRKLSAEYKSKKVDLYDDFGPLK